MPRQDDKPKLDPLGRPIVEPPISPEEAKAKATGTVWEPTEDAQGRLQANRAFTPEEAAAIDMANRETYLAARAQRFTKAAHRR